MGDGKVVLITGCSDGGIGHALALEFYAKGYRVIATARSMSKMKTLEGSGVECLQLDVTKAESITQAIDFLCGSCDGKLDILVNNAGVWLEAPALDAEIHLVKEMFEANVYGPMAMIQRCAPLLSKTQGCIVNISSILAIMPYPMVSAYNASKAALAQYSETLRLELEPLGIRVITIMSGQVSTNLVQTPHLSAESIYKSLQPALVQRARGHAEKSILPAAYATLLYSKLVKTKGSARLWIGTNSTVTWLLSTFAPGSSFYGLMRKMSGLDKAQTAIAAQAQALW